MRYVLPTVCLLLALMARPAAAEQMSITADDVKHLIAYASSQPKGCFDAPLARSCVRAGGGSLEVTVSIPVNVNGVTINNCPAVFKATPAIAQWSWNIKCPGMGLSITKEGAIQLMGTALNYLLTYVKQHET